MSIYNLPFDLDELQNQTSENVIIRTYTSNQNTNKNKIILHQNMINMIINGTKSVVYAENTTTISAGELLILSKGNCLTSEVRPENTAFTSILLYFSNTVLSEFLIKYKSVVPGDQAELSKTPFLVFRQDSFIKNYIESLNLMLKPPKTFSSELKRLKLEELLLYLLQNDPEKFLSLQVDMLDNEDMRIRKAVESNLTNQVTVEELAFICNCSISTFKRKFTKIYNTSPQKWLLEKKMQFAATLLHQKDEKPGLVYQKVGYENHSSFSKSFKQYHSITPTEYQQKILNVQPQ
ncbi:helix-turn-helix domain-containing protein [Dyadobacter subterraneus]|uniref:Helix-turn-helix transcriptional regulator n=1 Tax=Dyadobacter subterraneus TaxID=2773304 RepID=A0ABR9WA55_9BACT|nr:AraC family transcriptional regulator [Dyadobacter subterraneus]MBE9462360.1 helix-turn-helix transcriptional regulator [Dyadobacter subterraneus]